MTTKLRPVLALGDDDPEDIEEFGEDEEDLGEDVDEEEDLEEEEESPVRQVRRPKALPALRDVSGKKITATVGSAKTFGRTRDAKEKVDPSTLKKYGLNVSAPPASDDPPTVRKYLVRYAGESVEKFRERRAATEKMESIGFDPLEAIVLGNMTVNSERLGVKYDDKFEERVQKMTHR